MDTKGFKKLIKEAVREAIQEAREWSSSGD